MNLQKQVCSLRQAKKLRELGVEAESVFCYVYPRMNSRWEILQHGMWDANDDAIETYPSYNAAELGAMLADHQSVFADSHYDSHMGYWRCVYTGYKTKESDVLAELQELHAVEELEGDEDTESGVRADMLIYFLENAVITAEDCNNGLITE